MTRANVDPNLCGHVAPLGHNELIDLSLDYIQVHVWEYLLCYGINLYLVKEKTMTNVI